LNADYDKNEGFQFSLSGSIVNEWNVTLSDKKRSVVCHIESIKYLMEGRTDQNYTIPRKTDVRIWNHLV
jgi:hypothetical protein